MITKSQIEFFNNEGYLVVDNLLSKEEVNYYNKIYNAFLDNTIDASQYRSDLSGEKNESERITQIMVPSRVYPQLLEQPIHKRAIEISKLLLGDDMALDFDMLINKLPFSNTETPWHQDAAYWIDMPDKRAVSCWVAIDKSTKDNGCMWYTPKSHLGETLKHIQTGNKGALKCQGSETGSVFVALNPGSCVFHHGNTLHYSRGNTTESNRRALITNFRPVKMIELERSQGYDHTGERSNKA